MITDDGNHRVCVCVCVGVCVGGVSMSACLWVVVKHPPPHLQLCVGIPLVLEEAVPDRVRLFHGEQPQPLELGVQPNPQDWDLCAARGRESARTSS